MSTEEWPSLEEVKERYPVDPEGYARGQARIDAEITGYELAQLRKEDGLTQIELAHRMGVTQQAVSLIERGDLAHTTLETVRAYIEALGGTVRVVADMGSRVVDIRGLERPAA